MTWFEKITGLTEEEMYRQIRDGYYANLRLLEYLERGRNA